MEKGQSGHDLHIVNFIDCVKNRKAPACPAEVGRTVAVCTHMANIAVRTGTFQLEWDDQKGKFTNSGAANKLVKPKYRKPWKLPAI